MERKCQSQYAHLKVKSPKITLHGVIGSVEQSQQGIYPSYLQKRYYHSYQVEPFCIGLQGCLMLWTAKTQNNPIFSGREPLEQRLFRWSCWSWWVKFLIFWVGAWWRWWGMPTTWWSASLSRYSYLPTRVNNTLVFTTCSQAQFMYIFKVIFASVIILRYFIAGVDRAMWPPIRLPYFYSW